MLLAQGRVIVCIVRIEKGKKEMYVRVGRKMKGTEIETRMRERNRKRETNEER